MLKKVILWSIVLIATVGLVGCNNSKLYLTGDKEAIEAEVIIDGEKKGVMQEGSKSGALLILEVSSGRHNLLIVSKGGERLTTELEIKGENYLDVSFSKMLIRN